MVVKRQDALEFMKEQADCSADILFFDPPYALGSEVIIRADGKPDYNKAVDFMDKWPMPDGRFWEQFLKEAFRVLKFGGHCLMFGIDRQNFLFKYYGHLAGFIEKQSLYWYFISNFPKASDLSKMIDKYFNAEREIVGERKAHDIRSNALMEATDETLKKEVSVMTYKYTTATTPLAKKYSGYKYSVAPLKQVVEEIIVFQKPYKTNSCLHDVLAMEAGDKEITCGALDIDGNRVEIKEGDKKTGGFGKVSSGYQMSEIGMSREEYKTEWIDDGKGRYPSQAFLTGTEDILDENGDISKVLHRCSYETKEYDLFNYCPKVNQNERNAGLESYLTLKYNGSILLSNLRLLCGENTEQAELLKKVISGLRLKNFNIDISGENILVQCHRDFLSIIKTEIKQITELKILNLLMPLLIKEYTPIVKLEMENGGKNALNVEKLKELTKKTGIGQSRGIQLILGVVNAILELLLFLSNEKEWKKSTNFHCTVKPISLNEKILRLFKTPDKQRILIPFAGSGSEVIGAWKAGFRDIAACEINPDYVKIAEARIAYWTKQDKLF